MKANYKFFIKLLAVFLMVTVGKIANADNPLIPPDSVVVCGSTQASSNGASSYAGCDGSDATNWWSPATDSQAWWDMDLGATGDIQYLRINGHYLTPYWSPPDGVHVFVSETPFAVSGTNQDQLNQLIADTEVQHYTVNTHGETVLRVFERGRYIRVQSAGTGYLRLYEVGVYFGSFLKFPVTSFTINPDERYPPLYANVDASDSYDSDWVISAYNWAYGGNQTASGVNQSLLFEESGQHEITLAVIDDGQEKSITKTAEVFVLVDTDGDGMPDWYEVAYDLDPEDPTGVNGAAGDLDGDGVSNIDEYRYQLAANLADSDGDELSDAAEVRWFGVPAGETPDADSIATIGGQLGDVLFDENGKSLFGHCDDDKLIFHVLNRLTFGATPELYEELKSGTNCDPNGEKVNVGDKSYSKEVYDKIFGTGGLYGGGWINEQLNTLGIPGEQARREANGKTQIEILNESDVDGLRYQFYDKPVDGATCIRFAAPDNDNICSFEDDPLSCKCENAYDPGQCLRDIARFSLFGHGGSGVSAMMEAIRISHSNQHIRTRLGWFWDNHFNTDTSAAFFTSNGDPDHRFSYGNHLLELYESDTYFMGAFDNFYQDLLLQSAQSPNMIRFLDTDANIYTGEDYTPNENYARELLELHTLGELEGIAYDHSDIVNLARVFTGWSVDTTSSPADLELPGVLGSRYQGFNAARAGGTTLKSYINDNTGFSHLCKTSSWWNPYYLTTTNMNNLLPYRYEASNHDPGSKQLTLGAPAETLNITPNGEQEGNTALKFIADLSQTSEFICTKLARVFVSDDTNNATIAACASTFLAHKDENDQIKRVIRSLVDANEFQDPGTFRNKFKDRWEYIYGFYRANGFEHDVDLSSYSWAGNSNITDGSAYDIGFQTLPGSIAASSPAGLLPFVYPSPEGEPEDSSEWIANNGISINGPTISYLFDMQYLVNRRAALPYEKLFNRVFGTNITVPATGAGISTTDSIQIPADVAEIADKMIISDYLNLMHGSSYTARDVLSAYSIFNDTGDKAYLLNNNRMHVHRLRALAYFFSSTHSHRLQ